MRINIPHSSHQAVLWDMDGTIVDSSSYHKQAWRDTFHRQGIEFTEDAYQFTLGRRNDEIIRRYFDPGLSPKEVDTIAAQKEEFFRKCIKGNIRPFPFVIEMIKSLADAECRLAVVSSATLENIRFITEELGISTFFDLFITGKDVTAGKPSPLGYLKASDRLGVPARDCIVIEDAAAGVSAAKRGGMYCIAVTNTCPKEALAEADIVVNRLDEINIW
jgi:HAD superfamily hydrolase (TIGR01509 family)